MNKLSLSSLLALLLLTVRIATAQSPEMPPPFQMGPEMANPADIYGNEVAARADQMLQAGDKSGAMLLLSENFDRFSMIRAALFSKMLNTLLAQDNPAEASSLYLQYAKHDQQMARAGFDQVYNYFLLKKDRQALVAWTAQLAALSLPDDLKIQAGTWRMDALCSEGLLPGAGEFIAGCLAGYDPQTCRAIFSPAVAALVDGAKYADALRLLDMIGKESKKEPLLQSMVFTARIKIALRQKQWKEAETLFMKKAPDLAEQDLADLIACSSSLAGTNDERSAAGRWALFILKDLKDKTAAKEAAARCSLNLLKADKKLAEVPARFELFMASGIAPATVFTLYSDIFYDVILMENSDAPKQMLAFGAGLEPALMKPDEKKQACLLLMDGSFAVGDYGSSLKILDANAKYWQKDWLDSAKAKVGAHFDLQNKDYKSAVENFRKYMDYVAKNNTSAYNPATGQIYTKDMLLGFNALRIGDISRNNLKDEPSARKAYAEAEQHFQKAMKTIKPDSKESKYIDEQMAQIALRIKK